MDHTVTTPHMITIQCEKSRKICIKQVKKIMIRGISITEHQRANPWLTKKKARTVLFGQDMNELCKTQVGRHTFRHSL